MAGDRLQEMQKAGIASSALTKTTFASRSTNYQKVQFIENLHSKWLDSLKSSFDRMYEAVGAFIDINGGSWPSKERSQLIAQGRHPVSINISEQKLSTLAGSILSEKWDYNIKPIYPEDNSLVRGIKHKYYSDKEQYNYDQVDNTTCIRGLMHVGYEMIDEDYRYGRPGIIFREKPIGSVLEDPDWQTNSIHDWRRAIVRAWLTPHEILEKYQIDDADIERLALLNELGEENFHNTDDYEMFRNSPYEIGSRLLVMEYREMKKYKTTRLFGRSQNGEWVAFPLNIKKESEVREEMAIHGIESWQSLVERPYEDDILEITTVCPQATRHNVLTEGKSNIQCGQIGLFYFTSYREMGINKGLMEKVLDLNRTLNFRESKKDDVIAAGMAGGLVVNRDALGANADKKLKDLRENRTRPDTIIDIHGSVNEAIGLIPHSTPDASFWNEFEHLTRMFYEVMPVTPALEGAASKDESGILFELRHAVTKLGHVVLYDRWRQLLMDKAEAWYEQARITYKGHYFQTINEETGEKIEFNAPEYQRTNNGWEKVYLNSVEELPRANVIITLSRSSPTERFQRRMELMDQTKILSAHPELFKNQIRFLNNLMLRASDLDPEERAKVEQFATLEEMRDIMELTTQIKGLQAQGVNSDVMIMQLQQMIAQMQSKAQAAMGQGGPQAPQSVTPAPMDRQQGGNKAPRNVPSIAPPNEAPNMPGSPIITSRGEFQP